jgi:uncharacterized membrane protein
MFLRLAVRPDIFFVWIATVFGLIFVAIIPPLGGGNETFNFQRTATVAAGHILVEPTPVRPGIVDFLAIGGSYFPTGSKPPYGYSADKWKRLAAIPLGTGPDKILQPNAIAVLHPFSYIPQIPLFWIGGTLALPPLALFYLGRLGGLLAGISLSFLAIRIIPSHKYSLCAVALLPTITFSRSTLDADQFTVALAFLLGAMILREIIRKDAISRWVLVQVTCISFVLAQCKSAYLFLPMLACAIPRSRFSSTRAYAGAMALIILPGSVATFGWMLALKFTYFAGIHYQTWAGLVDPDAQIARILENPLGYIVVLGRTLFFTPLIFDTAIGFLGVFGPPVALPMPIYPILLGLLLFVLVSDGTTTSVRYGRLAGWLAAAICAASILLVLTLLYIQWTGYGSSTIQGFQGRYLYPLVPLMLMAVRTSGKPFLRLSAGVWLSVQALVGLISAVGVSIVTYFG